MTDSLSRRLSEFETELTHLPEADEPPLTMLQIIRNNQQEQDWQRLFFYYLSPDEPHGLDRALLEHFLSALSDREGLDFTYSRFDIADVEIEQEVKVSNDRFPDPVIWAAEDWFLCWELKIAASEGKSQTQDYIEVDAFEGIGLSKADVPDDGHHYLYLAPESGSPLEADAFLPISWEWVANEIQTFITNSHGEYPVRTIAQLETFIGTIQEELTMTQYQENQEEKAALYIDHHSAIREAEEAFQNEWETFTEAWGTRLAETLDVPTVLDDTGVITYNVEAKEITTFDQDRLWTLIDSIEELLQSIETDGK